MQIDSIEIISKTKVRVSFINGFAFSASRFFHSFVKKGNSWYYQTSDSRAPVWVSMSIERKLREA